MNKITVYRTHIEVSNYELGEKERLEYYFTIYDKLTHQFYYKGLEYDYNSKTLYLPRGIDIHYLEETFNESAVYMDMEHDVYSRFGDTMIRYMPRDEVQSETLRFMLGKGEYAHTENMPQLSVNLNTGAGKTYVTIASIVYYQIKSIVIASTVDWLKQWKKCLLEYTDMKEEEIVILTGLPSIIKIIKNIGKYKNENIKVFLVTHATLKNYAEKYGWETIGVLFKNLKIGIKVYDESHLNFDNIMHIDFCTNTWRTYYLTATPARSNDGENAIFKMYFKNVLGIDLFNEDSDPRTKYIAIRYNSNPSPQEIGECKNQYGLDRNRYTDYVVKKPNFYKLLRILLDMIDKVNGKVLIYIGTNAAIVTVANWIEKHYPEMYRQVGIFTSMIKEDKKAQLDKKIILSTTKSAGAALDIKGLKMTIVLAEPFKSEVLARQTLGRTRDNNTIYIDIVDMGFTYCKAYYNSKRPIFDKYALECSVINLSNDELTAKAEKLEKPKLIRPITYINKPMA